MFLLIDADLCRKCHQSLKKSSGGHYEKIDNTYQQLTSPFLIFLTISSPFLRFSPHIPYPKIQKTVEPKLPLSFPSNSHPDTDFHLQFKTPPSLQLSFQHILRNLKLPIFSPANYMGKFKLFPSILSTNITKAL